MCGICGFTGMPRSDTLRAMTAALAHRGPDDETYFESAGVSLGVRRLAILDIEHGRQPARSEDGQVVVALNGEIYNHRELRDMLVRRGHRLASGSDTEVLPHLYEEFGADFVGLLRGMFAIAIWDDRADRLLLVRDRLGEKPLLYAKTAAGLVFASELKCLLRLPEVGTQIDRASLRLYLGLQYVPGPGSMITGVQRLPPAHRLVVDHDGTRLERYWDLVPGEDAHALSFKGAAIDLRRRLEDAVALQVHADRPVGALLSGGIDSASIVALMKHVSGGDPPRTFTVGFTGVDDERPKARAVASQLGTQHTELEVPPPTFDDLCRIVGDLDEPIADQAAVPTALIARVASAHVTVLLTGEGSDELFSGYPRYQWFDRAERLASVPKSLRRPMSRAVMALARNSSQRRALDLLLTPRTSLDRHVSWTAIFSPDEIRNLLGDGETPEDAHAVELRMAGFIDRFRDRSVVEQMALLDLQTWLVDDILLKADRMTMAASIEGRAPFLDHPLVEYAVALPYHLRLRGRPTKALLRAAVADLLPPQLLDRTKRAFRVPMEHWLDHGLRDTLAEALMASDAAISSLIDQEAIRRSLDQPGARAGRQVWALGVLELWLQSVTAWSSPVGASALS